EGVVGGVGEATVAEGLEEEPEKVADLRAAIFQRLPVFRLGPLPQPEDESRAPVDGRGASAGGAKGSEFGPARLANKDGEEPRKTGAPLRRGAEGPGGGFDHEILRHGIPYRPMPIDREDPLR